MKFPYQDHPPERQIDLSIMITLSAQLDFFSSCLQSLAQKKHTLTLEIILLDDCSTGLEPSIIEKLILDHKHLFRENLCSLVYIRHSHKLGYYASLNEGLKTARGEYVQIIHSHDLLLPESLSKIENIIRKSSPIDIISGCFYFINQKDELIDKPMPLAETGLAPRIFLNRLLIENPLHAVSIVYHNTIFSQVGYFNIGVEDGGDWELLRRVVKLAKVRWYYLSEPLTCARIDTTHQSLREQLFIPEKYVWQIFDKGRSYLSLGEQKIVKKHRYFRCFSEAEDLLLTGKMDRLFSLILDLIEFSNLGDRLWLEVLNQSTFKHKQQIYEVMVMLMEKLETQ